MFRSIFSTIVGIVTAAVIVTVMQSLGQALFPSNMPYDPEALDKMAEYIANQPLPALLWTILGDTMGTTGGVFIAAYYARPNTLPAVLVSLFLLGGMIWTVTAIPYPTWFSIASLAAVVFGTFTGFGLARGRPKPSPGTD